MSDMEIEASLLYASIIKSKWYKKYIKLIEKEMNPFSYREVSNRVNKIRSIVDLDVEFISCGVNRLVVRYKNFAIKLLIYWNSGIIRERDLLCCLENRGLNSLKESLCPMYINDDYLAIFPFCENYEIPTWEKYETTNGSTTLMGKGVDTILDNFLKYGIVLEDVTKVEQWGRLNDKLVLLDYEDYTVLV